MLFSHTNSGEFYNSMHRPVRIYLNLLRHAAVAENAVWEQNAEGERFVAIHLFHESVFGRKMAV
jgi:hypothetical protein